jgi:putative tryptophan/tyrosine transport system substrate-binding protein
MPKRLELLKQLVPRAVRVAVLVNPESQFGPMALSDTQRAARELGLQLETFEVSPATDLEATFARIRQSRSEALTIFPEALYFALRVRIAELAIKSRLPFVAETIPGGSWSPPHIQQQRASHVPSSSHVHRPDTQRSQACRLTDPGAEHFELIINRKTANAIGLMVPQSLLDRANRVIE